MAQGGRGQSSQNFASRFAPDFGPVSGAVEDRFCGDPLLDLEHLEPRTETCANKSPEHLDQDGDFPHQDGDLHRSCAVAILSSTRLLRADTLASSNVLASLHWLRVLELASDCWRLCPSSVVFRWRLCPSRRCLRVVRVGSRALLIQRERAGHMCPRIDEEERFVLEKVAAVMRAAR